MSKLRPTLKPGKPGDPVLCGVTAYLTILKAVESRDQLIHGQLQANSEYCAVGSYFHINHVGLPTTMVDEVATINDSVPHLSTRQRKMHVVKWLKWKLHSLGFPGYAPRTRQTKTKVA